MRSNNKRTAARKKYKHPKVLSIELDPKLVVINTCRIGGGFFGRGGTQVNRCFEANGAGAWSCFTSVRFNKGRCNSITRTNYDFGAPS